MSILSNILLVFRANNYAENYSPEILKLQGLQQGNGVEQLTASSEPPVAEYLQNIAMPTLQKMHQITAASPRSTAKLFLLMEELSYRHL